MKIRLVTDSTSDIPAELVEKHQIEVVPALLVIDGKSYADGEDISRVDFYEKMPFFKAPATTAAPSSGSFIERYEKLFNAGAEKIISIHAASALSGIHNAARLAAETFGKRIHLIDSEQLGLGLGFQVLEAAEAIANGAILDEITALIESVQKRVQIIAALDTLEYLHRSGRVSWTKARLGKFFNLKPLFGLAHGKVENLGVVRTRRQAITRLKEMHQEQGVLERIAILHTNAEKRAREFLAEIPHDPLSPPPVLNVTTAIGAHLGPNGVGFAVLRK